MPNISGRESSEEGRVDLAPIEPPICEPNDSQSVVSGPEVHRHEDSAIRSSVSICEISVCPISDLSEL